MNEKLLQYAWQNRYFDQSALTTTNNEPIIILHPGLLNTNQGPDFSGARIRLGDTEWAGNVELHVQTADWLKHGHQFDQQYNNVILHVVWEHTEDQCPGIPVLELQGRIPSVMKEQFTTWMNNRTLIPCLSELKTFAIQPSIAWKEQLVLDRLSRKSKLIESNLEHLKGHWEEVFWWMVAGNFGISVNADAFTEMARSLPLSLISRHKHQIQQLEALLMGQCGLLNEKFTDPYPRLLQKEYQFLRGKYALKQINTPVQFLRMRPGNFPTVRLAQLAMLIHQSAHLFSKIKDQDDVKKVEQLFQVTANDFWHYHYRLAKESTFCRKTLGNTMIQSLLINTVVPALFTYGKYNRDKGYCIKALRWLRETPPELNNTTRIFQQQGIHAENAFDTQALLELKKYYCDERKCLECEIGKNLLGGAVNSQKVHT